MTAKLFKFTSGQRNAQSTPTALERAGVAAPGLLNSRNAKLHQLTAGSRDLRGQDGS